MTRVTPDAEATTGSLATVPADPLTPTDADVASRQDSQDHQKHGKAAQGLVNRREKDEGGEADIGADMSSAAPTPLEGTSHSHVTESDEKRKAYEMMSPAQKKKFREKEKERAAKQEKRAEKEMKEAEAAARRGGGSRYR